MEDMKVTASGYDFRSARAAMQRYVDGNLLSGFSSAVLVGRDLVDVTCIGWADKEAQTPLRVDHIFRVFSNTKLMTSCATLLLLEEGRFRSYWKKAASDWTIRSSGLFRSSRTVVCCVPARRHWTRPSLPSGQSPFVI